MLQDASRPPALSQVLLDHHFTLGRFERGEFFTQVVVPSGYPFFCWNGRVYEVAADKRSCSQTRFLVKYNPKSGSARIVLP